MASAQTAQIARVLYLSIVGSTVMVAGFFTWFPPLGDLEERARLTLLYGGFALGLGLCLVPIVIATRMGRPGEDRQNWWISNLPGALAVWGLFDAAAIVGGVCHFLTGERLTLLIPAAAILLLIVHAPGRIAGRGWQ